MIGTGHIYARVQPRNILGALLIMFLGCGAGECASEESDWLRDLAQPGNEPGSAPTKAYKPDTAFVRNDRLAMIGNESAPKLRAHAEAILKSGNYASAIPLLERALELSPKSADIRAVYAQALELKYEQGGKDPAVFNSCVKQWFAVFKNSDFLEDSNVAQLHLANLTGKRPKFWDLPTFYLPKVLKPVDEVTPPTASQQAAPQSAQGAARQLSTEPNQVP